MKEQLITFETAKLAKEKGFDIRQDITYILKDSNEWYESKGITQSLLQKWLREVHDIHISLNYESHNYSCSIGGYDNKDNSNKCIELEYWLPYEQALEEGLQEALKLI